MSDSPLRVINLVPVPELSSEQAMGLRDLRNQEEVRRWMYTDHVIESQEHRNWLDRSSTDDRTVAFGVLSASRDLLGLVSANGLDRRHRKTDWAFYLSSEARGGLGSALELAFIDFVFDRLGMEKLNCEVIEGNEPVLKLHAKFGFVDEGFRRSNIEKDGKRIGVHLLGLTKDEWREKRADVYTARQRLFDQFDIKIMWTD